MLVLAFMGTSVMAQSTPQLSTRQTPADEAVVGKDGAVHCASNMTINRGDRAEFRTHAEWRVMDGDGNPRPVPPDLEDLWIDVESLVFVRWEIRRAGVSADYGAVFVEQPNTQLRPPAIPKGLTLPNCVEWTKSR